MINQFEYLNIYISHEILQMVGCSEQFWTKLLIIYIYLRTILSKFTELRNTGTVIATKKLLLWIE